MKQCQACNRYTDVDRAHIKTRGAGAGWEDWEYIYLCRTDHILQGQIGWYKFINKYPHLKRILKNKGWDIEIIFGIPKLVRISNDVT